MPQVKEGDPLIPKADVREEPDYSIVDIQALRAVATGNASSGQQKRAMEYIINVVAGTYDIPFRPDSEGATLVAVGKAIVGKHIVGLLKHAKTESEGGEKAAQPREEGN